MNAAKTVTPSQLMDFLLNVAVVRPVFIWGPPGIGKSSLVARFAEQLGSGVLWWLLPSIGGAP